ncbi:structural maintenance of chromosomes protein 6 [Coccinella septempunctata]|uniref:structural maintenance of chromosomes protein 6 n=1 Tax=Coccinella septempunctata TaxID=41139 RepID=UPI001D08F358|nr:structural maintenance of chromosomes protein 6 [Coccinella septempunctata]
MKMEVSSSKKKRSQTSILNYQSKRPRVLENGEQQMRAGVITNMVLKNFMCHSLLEINFTSNASVVVGQNGSGKSAILTALILGLGGKASLTNRGTSIKGFVKAGKNSASLEITLCNEGPMAYRPKIYGPSITIIRNFTASGGSSYRIKSHTGEIISTQSKEIQNITTSLNIQIDNPVCILNQDTSRNFLSSNDPKHKFSLFMKATRLETLSNEYKKVEVNLKNSKDMLEDKTNNIRKLQEDIRNLKAKIEQHKSVRNLKEEEVALQTEILWSKVKDCESELQVETGEVEKLENKCENLRENSKQKAHEVEKLKKSISGIENQVRELKNAIAEQEKPYNDAKKSLERLQSVYKEKCREKQSIKNSIKSKHQDIKVLEQEIANANENKDKVEEQKAQRAQNISNLEQKLKANEDILQTARNDIFQLKSDIGRKEEDEKNIKQEIRELERDISKYQEKLDSVESESGNTLLFYGRNIPRVKQLIEQYKNKFRAVPRGPLGSYIKLKDKKWAVAAEGYIGPNLLNSFICDNKNDNNLLLQIFKSAGLSNFPTVITSTFFHKVHDISRNLVQAPYDCVSLFDILEIEDPVVTNCLIDQSSAEAILLIPNDERAMELLSNRANVPTNCLQGVTIKGDKYYPDPNYKTYCSDYHQAQYLQTDSSELIRNLKQKIQSLQNQKQTVINQYKKIKNDMNIEIEKLKELETKIRRLTTNRSELRRELDSIRCAPEPEAANIDVLENEFREIKQVLIEKAATLEQLEQDIQELKKPMDETETRITKFKQSIRNLEERLPPLQEQIREKNMKIHELSTHDEFDNRKLREWEERLKEHRAVVVAKQMNLRQYTETAEKVGPRPRDIRRVQDIVEKLRNLERSIRKVQASTESIEDIIEQYKILQEKFSKSTDILKKLKENVSELKMASNMRKKHYKATESYFISYIKHSFKKFLEFRKFQGSLDIDIERKKLELIVNPQQGTQGVTTTSNLSGGERSFSTVAFLYSLWQCMEFPFYFLDEFDVYMDKLNRTKVFDILLHHACSKPQLQFVFLTPQDISFLNRKEVTVLRLEAPKRLIDS